ncbi:MAG: hypothetical protein O7G85_03850 [Planctomycetota bacterium]|nr:hypothetical protein [Planctomycetota bacterium]
MINMRRGLGKIEILVILLIVGGVIAYIAVSLPRLRNAQRHNLDALQLRGIHQSMLVFSRDFNGIMPIPGFIRRLPMLIDGKEIVVPGKGAMDESQNTTANLYSVCIMQNLFSPELCVSPVECSPNVVVDEDYDWDVYDPAIGVHWDDSFGADLSIPNGSNVSYAHRPLFSNNFREAWRDSFGGQSVLLGTRGPRDGQDPNSITYQLHAPFDQWVGTFIGPDGSNMSLSTSMECGQVEVDGQTIPDNIFRFDQGFEGSDNIITFTKDVTPEGPVVLWD